MSRLEIQVAQLLKKPSARKVVLEDKQVQSESLAMALRTAPKRRVVVQKMVSNPAGLRSIMENTDVQNAARAQVLTELSQLFGRYSLEDIQSLATSGELLKFLPGFSGDQPAPPMKFEELVPLDLRTAPGAEQDKFAESLELLPS